MQARKKQGQLACNSTDCHAQQSVKRGTPAPCTLHISLIHAGKWNKLELALGSYGRFHTLLGPEYIFDRGTTIIFDAGIEKAGAKLCTGRWASHTRRVVGGVHAQFNSSFQCPHHAFIPSYVQHKTLRQQPRLQSLRKIFPGLVWLALKPRGQSL